MNAANDNIPAAERTIYDEIHDAHIDHWIICHRQMVFAAEPMLKQIVVKAHRKIAKTVEEVDQQAAIMAAEMPIGPMPEGANEAYTRYLLIDVIREIMDKRRYEKYSRENPLYRVKNGKRVYA